MSNASGLKGRNSLIRGDDNLPDGFRRGFTGGLKEFVGLANREILEEHSVELIVVILPGVDELTCLQCASSVGR